MGLNIGTLVLIAIGAVITIFAMIWGSMRRAAKAAAVAESERHEAAIRDAEADDDAAPEPSAVVDVPPEPATIPLVPVVEAVAAPAGKAGATDLHPLTTVKGLGPRAVAALAEQGITSVADLAALDPARAAAVDAQLGPLAGRLARDRWVEQAKLLSAGDLKGFEAAFGKIGG
ncbi:MAG: hypothetical protein K2Y20_10280 [Sphingomonas sp.]|nr:hypothetical protein [Sphingomonas sp.]